MQSSSKSFQNFCALYHRYHYIIMVSLYYNYRYHYIIIISQVSLSRWYYPTCYMYHAYEVLPYRYHTNEVLSLCGIILQATSIMHTRSYLTGIMLTKYYPTDIIKTRYRAKPVKFQKFLLIIMPKSYEISSSPSGNTKRLLAAASDQRSRTSPQLH